MAVKLLLPSHPAFRCDRLCACLALESSCCQVPNWHFDEPRSSTYSLLPVRQRLLPSFALRVPEPGSQMILLKAAAGGEGWLINLTAGEYMLACVCSGGGDVFVAFRFLMIVIF